MIEYYLLWNLHHNAWTKWGGHIDNVSSNRANAGVYRGPDAHMIAVASNTLVTNPKIALVPCMEDGQTFSVVEDMFNMK